MEKRDVFALVRHLMHDFDDWTKKTGLSEKPAKLIDNQQLTHKKQPFPLLPHAFNRLFNICNTLIINGVTI